MSQHDAVLTVAYAAREIGDWALAGCVLAVIALFLVKVIRR